MLWPKLLTTALADVEKLARIGRHLLDRLVSAPWASQLGFDLHHNRARFKNSGNISMPVTFAPRLAKPLAMRP
jgi:hypothetical protein